MKRRRPVRRRRTRERKRQRCTADEFLKHPFRALITGKSQSGKTTLAVDLLVNRVIPQVDRLIVVVASFWTQDTFKPLWQLTKVNKGEDTARLIPKRDLFAELTPDVLRFIQKQLHEKAADERVAIFIDDQAGSHSVHLGRKGVFATIANNAVWQNSSVIVLTQNLTSISPSFRDNVEGLIAFQTIKLAEFKLLKSEYNMWKTEPDRFNVIYEKATDPDGSNESVAVDGSRRSHNFLFILLATTPPKYFKRFDTELRFETEDAATPSSFPIACPAPRNPHDNRPDPNSTSVRAKGTFATTPDDTEP